MGENICKQSDQQEISLKIYKYLIQLNIQEKNQIKNVQMT